MPNLPCYIYMFLFLINGYGCIINFVFAFCLEVEKKSQVTKKTNVCVNSTGKLLKIALFASAFVVVVVERKKEVRSVSK